MAVLIRLTYCIVLSATLLCTTFARGQIGKLYWTDDTTDTINRSNLDGSAAETFIYSENLAPFDIDVDPIGGKVYWIEGGDGLATVRDIMRANRDGSGIEVILESISLHVNSGIALDVNFLPEPSALLLLGLALVGIVPGRNNRVSLSKV